MFHATRADSVLRADICGADSANTDAEVRDLEARARRAMGLPEDHRVHFTDLHDALTSMRFHGKQIPQV